MLATWLAVPLTNQTPHHGPSKYSSKNQFVAPWTTWRLYAGFWTGLAEDELQKRLLELLRVSAF